nr:type II toxin-antitoxin system HigB family toxin [Pseudopedobacter saltans]
MKRIIAKRTLKEFWERHPDAEQYLKTWYETVKSSNWTSPNDIKQVYANASILKNNRIILILKATHID